MHQQDRIRAAAIQMVSGFELSENLEQAAGLIDQAIRDNAELIVLPENFPMFSASRFRELAEREALDRSISNFLSNKAKGGNCYIVAGSVPGIAHSGKVFSSSLVFDNQGKQLARYDKIHLFDVDVEDGVGSYRESEHIASGCQPVCFEMQGVKVGLSICYDLRFPELYRALALMGCEILLVPSAFTQHTGEKHWEVLLRARAIENQCYVIAPNQGGEHITLTGSSRFTYGNSMIINEQGFIKQRLGTGVGYCIDDLDLVALRKARSNMPVLKHRKLN